MSCPAFIAKSFAVRTAAHFAHLSSQSYAEHVALDEFYSGLLDLVDKYAEVYMGLMKRIAKFPNAPVPAADEPIQLLKDYLDLVRDEMSEDHESQALVNILAEIEELTARSVYKLENLK